MGSLNMAVLYQNLCQKEVCYKGTALYKCEFLWLLFFCVVPNYNVCCLCCA